MSKLNDGSYKGMVVVGFIPKHAPNSACCSDPATLCPKCATKIRLTDSLTEPILAATRKEYEDKLVDQQRLFEDREKGLVDQEREIDRRKAALDDEIKDRLRSEREQIAQEEAQKAKVAFHNQLQSGNEENAELRRVLAERDKKLAEARKVEASGRKVRYLNIGARGKPRSDWHWIYVPEKRYPFYRVNVFSTAMSNMAPEGCSSICVEMADRGPVTETSIRDTTAALVAAGALGKADDVVFTEEKQIEYAYVVFDQHYYQATRTIFGFLESNGIFPRGRYGAWTYNAMEDCVLAGREVAALIDREVA